MSLQRDLQASLLEATEGGGVDALADTQQGWGDFGFGALFHDDEDETWNPQPESSSMTNIPTVPPPPSPPSYA